MSDDNNINYSEQNDKIQKDDARQFLNTITQNQSIKYKFPKKNFEKESSLENVRRDKDKKDHSEDNSDGTYKIINFL